MNTIKTITKDGYELTYNTKDNEGVGFYFIVKDLKDNKTKLSRAGFDTSIEALIAGQEGAGRCWGHYLLDGIGNPEAQAYYIIYTLFSELTGRAF